MPANQYGYITKGEYPKKMPEESLTGLALNSPDGHWIAFRDSRLLYYLIREIKTWLNINITVHNNTHSIF